MVRIAFFVLFLFAFASCNTLKPIPQPETEFRGFWVATVVNIDWPKNGKDPVHKQKSDFLELLDFYQSMNFNAAIVQIRTAGDAFYDSGYAPWSRFLTGEEGMISAGKKDLLEWMIVQTHARGMEFHAWLNPYRATFDLKTEVLSPTHDFYLHPEWMLKYGKKYYYDPGQPEVRKRVVAVIDEIVTNYDVDAIHFDDYFYPYRIKDETFRDSLSFTAYAPPGQSLDDWRRSNIDSLIKNGYDAIKAKKPWVQFGLSPFGVWRNKSADVGGSDTQAGQTTYDDLYANPLLWIENGWLDYIVPQVYWSMDLPVASHRKIVAWWTQKSGNSNLYIGNGPYKIRSNSDKAWEDRKELPRQITFARNKEAVLGNVFFSAKSLMKHDDVTGHLIKKYYRRTALPPISKQSPKNEKVKINITNIEKTTDTIHLTIDDPEAAQFALVYPSGKRMRTSYPIRKLRAKLPVSKIGEVTIPTKKLKRAKYIALIFIDRYRQQTEPIVVHLEQ